MIQKRYKAVAFDLNGLILKGENFEHSWKAIWGCLGYDERIRKELYNKHHSNPKQYSFYQWTVDCVEYFKEQKMHKTYIDQIIQKHQINFASDFLSTLQILKKNEIRTAIISGGVSCFIDILGDDIKQLIDKIYINTFHFDNNGFLIGFTPFNFAESEYHAKSNAISEFCTFSNCTIEECIYVSDGNDSIDIVKYCGLCIVVDCSLKNSKHISDVVKVRALGEILTYILES
jgi:phosphoserine phosphatase